MATVTVVTEDTVQALIDEVKIMREELYEMHKRLDERVINVKGLARRWGVSKEFINKLNPEFLPGGVKGEFEFGPIRWKEVTVREFERTNPDFLERRAIFGHKIPVHELRAS